MRAFNLSALCRKWTEVSSVRRVRNSLKRREITVNRITVRYRIVLLPEMITQELRARNRLSILWLWRKRVFRVKRLSARRLSWGGLFRKRSLNRYQKRLTKRRKTQAFLTRKVRPIAIRILISRRNVDVLPRKRW